MLTREKTVMKRVIDTIEANGPTTIKALVSLLGMTRNAIRRQCLIARNDGYLAMEVGQTGDDAGQWCITYTRTEKAYEAAMTVKMLKESERRRRQRENQRRKEQRAQAASERSMRISQPFVPFRHPFDVILFGNVASSGHPSSVAGRVIQQW